MKYSVAGRYNTWIIPALLFSALLLASCNVIRQTPVDSDAVAISGNSQDAGIGSYVQGKGFPVSERWNTVYNTLIGMYGTMTMPETKKNDGITVIDGQRYVDGERMVVYLTMCRWYRMAKPPATTLEKLANSVGL